MSHRLLIVPGASTELRELAGQIAGDVVVQVADSANDALWEVRNAPPTVMLANVQLEGMSGLDIAEILPNFGVPTRLILWAASADAKVTQTASDLGVYRLVLAGQDEELRVAIGGALQESSAAAAAEAAAAAAAAREAEATPPPPPEPPPVRPARREPPPARPPEQVRSRSASANPVPATPAPPAPVAAEPAARPPRRRDGPLVLTAEDIQRIRLRMDGLDRDVGSRCILLADRAGMILAETGHSVGLPTMVLLPLLSTSFSTAGQITSMLREKESSALYVHEGSHFDLYCFDMLQRYMLVIVFDKTATSAKIGSVWVYAKRAIRDIQEMLA